METSEKPDLGNGIPIESIPDGGKLQGDVASRESSPYPAPELEVEE